MSREIEIPPLPVAWSARLSQGDAAHVGSCSAVPRLWLDRFQIIQDGFVRFRISRHYRPVLVMASLNKKIATPWDDISIPAEDDEGVTFIEQGNQPDPAKQKRRAKELDRALCRLGYEVVISPINSAIQDGTPVLGS